MSWFEIEYLIQTSTSSLTDNIALFASIQFGAFAVIYLLRDIHDGLVRHAVLFLYSLTWIFSFAKTIMDLAVVGAYTRILADILKTEQNRELLFGQFADEIGYSFMGIMILVYLSLWAATFYFLYFHKFASHPKAKL